MDKRQKMEERIVEEQVYAKLWMLDGEKKHNSPVSVGSTAASTKVEPTYTSTYGIAVTFRALKNLAMRSPAALPLRTRSSEKNWAVGFCAAMRASILAWWIG